MERMKESGGGGERGREGVGDGGGGGGDSKNLLCSGKHGKLGECVFFDIVTLGGRRCCDFD